MNFFSRANSFRRNYKNKHCYVTSHTRTLIFNNYTFGTIVKYLFVIFRFVKGSINAGIGATGMNVFLTSLNIPWLSKRAYKFREEEAIEGILHVTKETCTEAISREVGAVVESNPTETTR